MSDSKAVDCNWVEVPCQRQVNGTNFSSGLQDFVFSIGRPSVWYPSKSYFRVNLTVTGAGAVAPTVPQQLALAEGAVANMYNNAQFLAGGQVVSQINNYLAQANMVEVRTGNAAGWIDKVSAFTSTYNGDYASRVAAISSSSVGQSKIGVGLAEGKEEIYKPTTLANYAAATVAITGGNNVVAAVGVNTAFTAADVGSDLVVGGVRYTVLSVTDVLNLVLSAVPQTAVAATIDWYMVRRNYALSTQARNVVQVLWVPTCLGIFNWEGALGAGDYRIQLNPNTDISLTALQAPINTGTAAVTVDTVFFYAAIAKESIPDGLGTLYLREFQVQSKAMSTADGNFNWTVPASTRRIYLFLQDTAAGSNRIIPPSVFRVGSGGTLLLGLGEEKNLTALQITYANQTKPQTRWTSGMLSGATRSDLLVQLYTQSLMETGRYRDPAGAESMDQWMQRGPLYAWNFERDSEDRSTEVQTQVTYGATADGVTWATANLFLVAEYDRATEITSSNGMIVNVRGLNI